MGILEKIPRQGSISAKELAANVQKNEEVLSRSHGGFRNIVDADYLQIVY